MAGFWADHRRLLGETDCWTEARQQADMAMKAGLMEPVADAWLLLACSVASQDKHQKLTVEAFRAGGQARFCLSGYAHPSFT
jgi:hypothetical protein